MNSKMAICHRYSESMTRVFSLYCIVLSDWPEYCDLARNVYAFFDSHKAFVVYIVLIFRQSVFSLFTCILQQTMFLQCTDEKNIFNVISVFRIRKAVLVSGNYTWIEAVTAHSTCQLTTYMNIRLIHSADYRLIIVVGSWHSSDDELHFPLLRTRWKNPELNCERKLPYSHFLFASLRIQRCCWSRKCFWICKSEKRYKLRRRKKGREKERREDRENGKNCVWQFFRFLKSNWCGRFRWIKMYSFISIIWLKIKQETGPQRRSWDFVFSITIVTADVERHRQWIIMKSRALPLCCV